MKIKIVVGIALLLFTIIIASIGTAGLILYDQSKNVTPGQKLASTDLSIINTNPSVQSDTELGGISSEVVANHGSASDCWMIIDGNVYDFTNFLNSHPGTAATMTPYCGKDGTAAYVSKDKNPPSPHSQIARDLLNQYFLGKVGTDSGGNMANNPTAANGNPNLPTATNKPGLTMVPTSNRNISTNTGTVLTTADVATHSTASNCWIIVNGNVYAVSNYLSSHPGGSGVITAYCGRDATNAFNTKNTGSSHSSFAVSQLGAYLIGRIGSPVSTSGSGNQNNGTVPTFTSTPTPTNLSQVTPIPGGGGGGGTITLSTNQVAAHNTLQDCWVIISNKVYNLTPYIPQHPGGQNEITRNCGRDGSTDFATRGGGSRHSNFAQNLLNNYYIGDLGASVPVESTPTPTQPGGMAATPTTNNGGVPAVVLQRYPDATLRGDVDYEDDGRMELKINTGGQCRDIKINSSGAISEDKRC